jgi:hypothetical protein
MDRGRTNTEERAHGWSKMEPNGKEMKDAGRKGCKMRDGRKWGQNAGVES